MKLRKPLDDILNGSNKVKILRVLASPGLELTGREIAKEAKINHAGCLRTLADLVDVGIVEAGKTGQAQLYSLRYDNYLVERAILPLFQIERSLFEAAIEFLRGRFGGRTVSAVLFGGYARSEETHESDLDILFLVESEEEVPTVTDGLLIVATEFSRRFGLHVNSYVKTVREAKQLAASRRPPIREILREGIDLFGQPLRQVLRYGPHKVRGA